MISSVIFQPRLKVKKLLFRDLWYIVCSLICINCNIIKYSVFKMNHRVSKSLFQNSALRESTRRKSVCKAWMTLLNNLNLRSESLSLIFLDVATTPVNTHVLSDNCDWGSTQETSGIIDLVILGPNTTLPFPTNANHVSRESTLAKRPHLKDRLYQACIPNVDLLWPKSILPTDREGRRQRVLYRR